MTRPFCLTTLKYSSLIVGVMLSVCLSACAGCRSGGERAGANAPPAIVSVFRQGEARLLSPAESAELAQRLTAELESCNDLMRVVLDRQSIDALRSSEAGVELSWKVVRTSRVGPQELTFGRLLIPLSGQYATQGGLSFILGNPEYSGPVYVKTMADSLLHKRMQHLAGVVE